jgi:hypothetical protein
MKSKHFITMGIVALVLAGCAQGIPTEALQLSPTSLADREMQTRRFDTNEADVLSASAQVLQDLGFQLDESETKLGVLVGSKTRDATEAGQVAGAVFVALLGGGAMPIDKEQKIRASVVSQPVGAKSTKVRVTFQRLVWNTQGQLSKIERLNDSSYYQGFFDKLSESVFLEAHKI